MGTKICKAIEHATPITLEDGTTGEMVEFLPEDGRALVAPITIHPDEDGQQWYWMPDDAPTLDTSSQPQK